MIKESLMKRCAAMRKMAAALSAGVTCFTREVLWREAEAAGFRVCGFFGDVAGSPYYADSDTIAVKLEK